MYPGSSNLPSATWNSSVEPPRQPLPGLGLWAWVTGPTGVLEYVPSPPPPCGDRRHRLMDGVRCWIFNSVASPNLRTASKVALTINIFSQKLHETPVGAVQDLELSVLTSRV